MIRCRKSPSQTWRTFPENHVSQLVSIDFFTVPTISFNLLSVFLVLTHDRRRIPRFHVTRHPTAEWTGQQLRNASPSTNSQATCCGIATRFTARTSENRHETLGIEEVLSTPRSPWQRAYVERMIGSLRRECLDHVIVFG